MTLRIPDRLARELEAEAKKGHLQKSEVARRWLIAGISPEEKTAILNFINYSPIYALDDDVIEQAIHLRQ